MLNREINPIRNPGLFMADLGLPGSNTTNQDPLVELSKMNTGNTPAPLFTFEGLGTDGYTPPDTMGEVGPNHYVQMVNVSFAIYDKSGNVVKADTLFTDLFAGSGLSYCSSQNDGDPVVLWDSMADRWLLSQFAVTTTPEHMCIAVSQTADPAGAYYLYQFEVPDFPDYFKFGVWPDAYYMGTNTGYPNQYYAYAFDRAAMLAGLPATFQYVNGYPNFLLPADLDGPTQPPANTPGYFYTMLAEGYPDHPAGVDRVVLYEFDVDWTTPANSTFTAVQEIPVADYNYTTCGFFAGDCIPQPGTTQKLDAVDPWPMWRFAYRNLTAYEALVGNFTVDTNGADHAGIRWFELQKSGASWTLNQEGTHSPDTDHRWMGSIAMDGSGNIALGYSVSSLTTYPSLRYASRLRSDPLGTLQAEATLYAGGGSQTGPYDRWGDYSSMSVDPTDECTFWYTGEYHDVSDQSFNWNTRIGTFRLPECTGYLGASGTLDGTITDSSTTNPLSGVNIYATNGLTQTGSTVSQANGAYSLNLLVGDYDVTASAFGYLSTTVSAVSIYSGTTTTVDIALDPAPSYTVSGTVTDVNTGWPLYAGITIAGYPGGTVWTDPVTGAYSVVLPGGTPYDFTVTSFIGGYLAETRTVAAFASNVTEDFALNIDAFACSAPGYSISAVDVFTNSFEAVTTFPGDGWDQVDTSGTASSWATSTATVHPAGQPPHGGARLAYFNSYTASSGNSTRLFRTVDLDLSAASSPSVSLWMYHDTGYTLNDRVQVQVSTDAGATWTDVGTAVPRYDGSVGWKKHIVDISANAGAAAVRIGFNAISAWGNDVHIDDVAVADLGCVAPVGALVVGNVYDNNTNGPLNGAVVSNDAAESSVAVATPQDTAVDDAFYALYSPSGSHVFTATMTGNYSPANTTLAVVNSVNQSHDFYLDAGWLAATPSGVSVSVELGNTTASQFTLDNLGGVAASFTLKERNIGASADFLLVAYDGLSADALQTAVTELGYTVDRVTDAAFQGLTVDDLLTYQIVMYAGSTSAASRTLMMAYMDAGGSLYITDNDLGYFQKTTVFYQTYLQSTYVADDGGALLTGEDIMAGLNLDITADPFPDSFTVGAEGYRIFAFPANAGGVRVDRLGYKAIYTSFDYRYIASHANALELAQRIINYLAPADVVPWLSAAPITGTIAPAGNQVVSVGFDANNPSVPQPGVYLAEFQVSNDTPYGSSTVPVTMTVTPPASYGFLEGTVTGLGYCDANPVPAVGAAVDIEASSGMTWTLTADANGYYSLYLDQSNSPITVTVAAAGHEGGLATGVAITGQYTTTQNFDLRLLQPCVTVDPTAFDVEILANDTTTRVLMIDNGGALGTDWEVVKVPVAGLAGTPVLLTAPSTTAIESTTSANVVTIGDLSLSRAGQPTGAQVTPTRLPQSPEAMTITHSASQTIMDVNSIACNDGLSHSDNSYLRAFTLADFGIYADFTVSSVDIGIESASGAGGVQPVTVNLYTLNGPLVWANMTLIGTVNTAVSDQNLTIINVPVTGVVPSGGTLVVEVFTPDGSIAGNLLFVGSNNLGETAPTYLVAADCSITEPTDTTTIGFPDMQMVMNVTGEVGDQDIPWLSTDLITGTVAADSTSTVSVIFDTTVLTQTGVYNAILNVKSGDPMHASIQIPVTMTVVAPEISLAVTVSTSNSCGVSDTLEVVPGTVVYYCYTVTNTGNMMLPTHTITDSVMGHIDTFSFDLAPGASESVIYPQTITADTASTITWMAENSVMGGQAMATDTATVTVTRVYLPIVMKP
ncbi:MAG: carboxypeptidase regulatory-like domain-containing protein [Chloroflexi bacterium]|nr:carboxypeptidase regulatory-like domain-containing protein [Chloroflexota bacterium]